MGTVGLFGSILRFIFIFQFNYKKMRKAYLDNKKLEKGKDITVGVIGFAVLLASMIIGYEVFVK